MAFPQIHDLIRIDSFKVLAEIDTAPAWVQDSIQSAPFVTVRRWRHSDSQTAVGVRGKSRDKRWASFINNVDILEVISPCDLRLTKLRDASRIDSISSLADLRALEEEWAHIQYAWGPGGSVGFELATGVSTSTQKNDLDIILFAPNEFSKDFARELYNSATKINPKIDILVEAPEGAFSLQEFASSNIDLLLRTFDGPRRAANPWMQVQPLTR